MYLTIQQVGEKLKVSRDKIRKLIESGVLPTLPIDSSKSKKYYRVDERAVAEYRRSLAAAKPIVTGPAPAIPPGFVSAPEAAMIAGVAENTLFGRVAKGQLEKIKVGNRVYFRADQLKMERRKPVLAQPAAPVAQPAGSAQSLLSGLINRLNTLDALETRLASLEKQFAALADCLGWKQE